MIIQNMQKFFIKTKHYVKASYINKSHKKHEKFNISEKPTELNNTP